MTAIGALSCVVLLRSDFTRVLDKVPELRDALLHGMARRIHELDQRVWTELPALLSRRAAEHSKRSASPSNPSEGRLRGPSGV